MILKKKKKKDLINLKGIKVQQADEESEKAHLEFSGKPAFGWQGQAGSRGISISLSRKWEYPPEQLSAEEHEEIFPSSGTGRKLYFLTRQA